MVMKWCTKFAGLIIGVIQVKKLQAICRPVFLSICLMENIMEVHDFSIFILHFLMENVMENFMEVHNFSIFILRFFSIFSPYSFPLYGEKAEMNMEKISAFSPLSSIKSGVSILPIIWRKSRNEYGENFRFFLRFFSIMIFSLFLRFFSTKSGVSILPSIRFSAFTIWRIYGDLRYGEDILYHLLVIS